MMLLSPSCMSELASRHREAPESTKCCHIACLSCSAQPSAPLPGAVSCLMHSPTQALSRRMAAEQIMTMAAGGVAPTFRMYLHAQSAGPSAARLLVEILLNATTSSAALTVKSQDATSAEAFGSLVQALVAA